jgi:5-(carboxyamino)imidazole ribonucleotide synthase
MLALEARRMGYRVAVLDPQPRGPAAQVADIEIVADFNDLRAASELAEKSDVITVDTDHIPAHVLKDLSGIRPVRPSARVVATIQDRLKQREFLEQLGAAFHP